MNTELLSFYRLSLTVIGAIALSASTQADSLAIQENGTRVDLIFTGTHTIEAAASLTSGPWLDLGSQTSPFTDPNSDSIAMRFYRINDSGVFSDNLVGYYRLNICAGFSMDANQLNASGGNTVTNVFQSPPDGTAVFKFNPTSGGYSDLTYLGGAWEGNHPEATLNPGEGAFVYTGTPFTQRFLGEVSLSSSVLINSGWNLMSAAVPQSAPLTDPPPGGLGFPIQDGDQLFQFPCGGLGYIGNSYIGGAWEGDGGGATPSIAVGEAFWLFRGAAAAGTWNRTFTVGP